MKILFPSDYFTPSKPDEIYQPQAQALAQVGFGFATTNIDELGSSSKTIQNITGEKLLYRGWMLTAGQYEQLVQLIQKSGGTPITSLSHYLDLHYLPRWYPKIAEFTPETIIFPLDCDLAQELKNLAWESYFIKDYVKSLKTSLGSIIQDVSQIPLFVQEMTKYRGQIEGGWCVRRVEPFNPTTEQRYFVVNQVVYPADPTQPIPEIVQACSACLSSPFFAIDAIQTTSGRWRIVEVGDGQVSDIVGWSPERLAEILAQQF